MRRISRLVASVGFTSRSSEEMVPLRRPLLMIERTCEAVSLRAYRRPAASVSCRGLAVVALSTLIMGCTDGVNGSSPIDVLSIPTMPMPMPGQATLAGVVRDGDGHGIAGATIKLAETDGVATADATGAYQMMVPSDSTLTLVTSAMGFATTYRESIILATQSMASGFDLLLLPATTVSQVNALGPPNTAAARGLMAIRLHSMNPACATPGAHVAVWPPLGATVVYSRPSVTGGLDEPDSMMDGVQPGAHIDLWLTGIIVSSNLLRITVEQAGCQLMDQGPSVGGLILTGQRRVDVQALTEGDLFLD